MKSAIEELLEIMRRLRAPDGCPWDRAQTFATIAPYTIEEAYEVADAIAREDSRALRDELGDLLFQVVFHARIAQEAGQFDFESVARSICDKLTRRHPHVFAGTGSMSASEQSISWEDIKARERQAQDGEGDGSRPLSHLHGVPQSLPALMRAFKLSKRAARVGFDWDLAEQTADKVAEELAEVREAARNRLQDVASEQVFEEVGDLLFAAANLARKLEVDAEAALRAANAKFERRFRGMEALAAAQGEVFANLDLAAQERLWLAVKNDE